MASITGYVQSMQVFATSSYAKVGIGPSPDFYLLLLVLPSSGADDGEIAFHAAIVDSLSAAFAARREVTATYTDGTVVIDGIELERA